MGLVFLLCYLVAFICFVLAACNAPQPRVNLIGAGLAAWVLPTLIQALKGLG